MIYAWGLLLGAFVSLAGAVMVFGMFALATTLRRGRSEWVNAGMDLLFLAAHLVPLLSPIIAAICGWCFGFPWWTSGLTGLLCPAGFGAWLYMMLRAKVQLINQGLDEHYG